MTVIRILLAELFTSLSDDSQRLFVRLYTRKGFFSMQIMFHTGHGLSIAVIVLCCVVFHLLCRIL